MSYLQLPEGIDAFDKAVISLWFRVPQASIDAATAQYHANPQPPPPDLPDLNLRGIIPLIIFGPNPTATGREGDTTPTSPSFLGIRCGAREVPNAMDDVHVLQARIQYPDTYTTPFLQTWPDFFIVGGAMEQGFILGTARNYSYIDVTADHWHHVLMSFDMSGGCSTSMSGTPSHITFQTSCKFWWAYDDVNYDGPYLPPYGETCYDPSSHVTGDRNGIVSSQCIVLPASLGPGGVPIGSASFAAGPIPTNGQPIGSPTSSANVEFVYPVELAELQFFTDVTLDTSLVSNRRVFITASTPDLDDPERLLGGTPVPPVPQMIDNPDYDPDLPVSPTNPVQIPDPDGNPAEKLLGKKADILLHGSGNWSIGKNTGPMVDNPDYNPALPVGPTNPIKIPDPAKQFTPTGKIVSYTPDPSLYGPQSPPPPAVRLQRRIRVPA